MTSPREEHGPLSALVIEDSGTTRRVMAGLLREAGFVVSEAADGREGLARLRELGAIALVVVDWNMPELDGLQTIEAIRGDRSYDPVRLLMVTTEAEKSRVVEALKAGANEYLMKPFTREMLLEKLALLGFGGAT
jgi:two-component system chemotaxis response regulator CheY